MKKLTVSLTFVIAMLFAVQTANAQPPYGRAYGHHKYYYYPERNVYYDPYASQYYYNTGTSWSATATLPSGFSISLGSPRTVIYSNGRDPWYDNSMHVRRYNEGWMRRHWKHRDRDHDRD
jgi:hypothetical protein